MEGVWLGLSGHEAKSRTRKTIQEVRRSSLFSIYQCLEIGIRSQRRRILIFLLWSWRRIVRQWIFSIFTESYRFPEKQIYQWSLSTIYFSSTSTQAASRIYNLYNCSKRVDSWSSCIICIYHVNVCVKLQGHILGGEYFFIWRDRSWNIDSPLVMTSVCISCTHHQ